MSSIHTSLATLTQHLSHILQKRCNLMREAGAEPGCNRPDAAKAMEVEISNNSFVMKSKGFASAVLREDHP